MNKICIVYNDLRTIPFLSKDLRIIPLLKVAQSTGRLLVHLTIILMLIPEVALRGRIVTIGTHALFHHLVIVLHHFHLIVETEGILIKFLHLRFLFQVPPTILRDHVHRQIRPLTLRLAIDLLLSLPIFLMKILLFLMS